MALVDTQALQMEGEGMTPIQAAAFTTKWHVITQHTDAANGLSATVFEEVVTGVRYLAVRGTTDPLDTWTDFIDIAVLGTPERQAQYAALKDQVAVWLSDGTSSSRCTSNGCIGGVVS